MTAPDAPRPPAADPAESNAFDSGGGEGADAEYMAFHRLVGYARHAEGCAYSDTSDAACSCGLWEAHDTLGNLLATRPAPPITAAERAALCDAAVLCELVRDWANHDDVPCRGETCAYCYAEEAYAKVNAVLARRASGGAHAE